jgi:hypothetical protein
MALSRGLARVQRYGCKTPEAKGKLADSLMSLSTNIQSAIYVAVFVTAIPLIITLTIDWLNKLSTKLSTEPQAEVLKLSSNDLWFVTAVVVVFAAALLFGAWILAERFKLHALNTYDEIHSPPPSSGRGGEALRLGLCSRSILRAVDTSTPWIVLVLACDFTIRYVSTIA